MQAPLLVEEYRFGWIKIGGRPYTRDIVFTPAGILDDAWWRREGHVLYWEDLEPYIREAAPSVVIVGTGHDGMLKIDYTVVEALRELGVELLAAPTREAVDVYNRLAEEGARVLAALHLTC